MKFKGDGVVGDSHYDVTRLFAAYERVTEVVHRTPCKQSETLNEWTDSEVRLKLENMQKTGSFKIRGAYNKISQLNKADCGNGLIAASAGNHAQGVAMAGRKKGLPVTIFMPTTTTESKVSATQKYGAKIELIGKTFDEAYAGSRERQLATRATFIHPFDDLDIIEGQATVAMEMLQQSPDLEMIVVPAGGGGLLAGTALAIKAIRPDVKVVGVQAANTPAIISAYNGVTNNALFLPTIAEGISVKQPGQLPVRIIRKYVDAMVTVTEKEISETILFMLEREKTYIEGAAAAAIAAITNGCIPIKKRKVGVIVSGGNFDVSKIAECITMSNDKSAQNF